MTWDEMIRDWDVDHRLAIIEFMGYVLQSAEQAGLHFEFATGVTPWVSVRSSTSDFRINAALHNGLVGTYVIVNLSTISPITGNGVRPIGGGLRPMINGMLGEDTQLLNEGVKLSVDYLVLTKVSESRQRQRERIQMVESFTSLERELGSWVTKKLHP